ncbi:MULTISPECIES: acyl-CoA dehydrogenase family protein [unclassified Amycolatopsis]|uniref:acyl-CoA dehydrogenase family protein n=1 Tax=unclassified Amycolatopsis TaxID=2618356 RepID=UPI001FF63991|nr:MULTISPECIES: acyl-CoA dehydrogenase family protein [unclassified Amycolatopsis]UOZ06702.1 acyl-CoA/acyl-ACP dehydrogenase [Amycolatopsis sp. WQ 127309]WSJ73003.1 acyl-CoA/acyl-ACP dehydrogenase [Amycolatopsis sp. NBC_01307]WSK83270.1 acyl-CoA/acyl-ACP dehydrogenase [Amycolatopsis sp. NBC_01286]
MLTETVIHRASGALYQPVTEEGRALLDLIDEHLPAVRAGAADHDRAGTLPVDVIEAYGRNGVLGGTVPAELGGLGVRSLYDVAVALSRVAEADASTALVLHAQFSRGLTFQYEWKHGSPAAQQLAAQVLKLMAAGDPVCGGVKDHHSGVTTLTRAGSGEGWVLNGRKTLVTMAGIAKHVIVSAETRVEGEPHRLAAPVLAADTPGMTIIDNWDGLGMRASGTVDIVFENCLLPDENVLLRGVVGTRSDVGLAGQTVSSCANLGVYVGVAQAARDIAVAAVARRKGTPAAAVRTLVAEIDTRLYSVRATVGSALANADIANVDLSGDLDERGRLMMLPFQYAKQHVNKVVPDIVGDCLTLTGGASFTAGHPLARLYRDARAGCFMQPYTYPDAVDYLSAQALGLDHDSNYMNVRAARSAEATKKELT